MKKVAIITLQGMNNYGNRLQNYAVTYTLKHNTNKKIYNLHIEKLFSRFRVILSCIVKRNIDTYRYFKFLNFSKIYSNDIVISENKDIYEQKFDYVICGSDQIWNLSYSSNHYYYGGIVTKDKRIAYSASFGVSEIPDEYKDMYIKHLSKMKAISVREDSGAKIVKDLIGIDVPVLIDPTMMLTKDEWCKIIKKPRFYKKSEKYILTYFLGDVLQEYREYIENFAKENGCKVINLERHNTNKYWYYTGPSEFVWLIKNCTTMFTDSFHACVFSILMNVPFVVFDRDGTGVGIGTRIDTLLDKFNLNDRKFSNQNTQQVLDVDYSHIEPILNIERKKSIDFLKDAMEM